jgi:hypothetical protein
MANGLPREWHGGSLPPGTPAPYSTSVIVTCPCGEQARVTKHHEMGAVDITPEECPECCEPWPEDLLESEEPDEPDPDIERDRERGFG